MKPGCRAVVLTVPPLPVLLMPSSEEFEVGRTSHLHSFINTGLKKLSTNRFHVLDLDEVFISDSGIIEEDLFER